MSTPALAFVFAAGGTGGHIFPALAVAEELRRLRPDARCEFVGTHGKMEERIVPEHGFPIHLLWIAGIDRRKKLRLLLLPVQVCLSVLAVVRMMRTVRPSAAVCAGSYVSYPVGVAARLLRVPLVLMESNARPGKVIRALSVRAAAVHVAFEASKKFFARTDNLILSGNPVRADLARPMARKDAADVFGLDASKPTILVFGGSLGARAINATAADAMRTLRADGVQMIWQTGTGSEHAMAAAVPGVWQNAFIDDMRAAYAASDIVVCRAGGTTLAELAVVGAPSILVPYPHHADQHQLRNAEAMEEAGAAVVVREEELPRAFLTTVRSLLAAPERRARMSAAARALGVPDAAERIARSVLAFSETHD